MKNFIQSVVANYKKINKQDEKQNAKKFQDIKYPKCPLGGAHEGEYLSQVCLEKECQKDQILCCCMCVEDTHKGHNFKPIKILLYEFDHHIREKQECSLTTLDKDLLNKRIKEQEIKTLTSIDNLKQQFVKKMNTIETTIGQYFQQLRQQIKSKDVSASDQQKFIQNICNESLNIQTLQKSIQELMDSININESPNDNLTYEEINKILDSSIKDTTNTIQQLDKKIESLLDTQIEYQVSKLDKNLFFKQVFQFQFLPQYKHQQIEIVNPFQVKACSTSHGYKFAVMSPAIDMNTSTSFAFKLVNVHASNWLAVGLCSLNVVQQKSFGFSFQHIGHGGFLISSNGGSWSTTTATQNNIVKCFKFSKGDTINCTYEPQNEIMTFGKAKTALTYKLDVPKSDQILHPCVLFYYSLDEVEFIPPEKVQK